MDICFNRLRDGYYNADPSKRLPPLDLTFDQALLTMAAVEMFCHFGGLSFHGILAPVTDALTGNKYYSIASALPEKLSFGPSAVTQLSSSTFVALLDACLRHRPTTLVLGDPSPENPLSVRAERLLFRSDNWWLIAQSDDKELQIPLSTITSVVVS